MFSHRRLGPLFFPVALILVTGILVISLMWPVSPRYMSRESLRLSFDADMSKVVYAWDPLDPRPEKQRKEALFDFVYEGYQSSVWVPQASLEGNWLTRVFLGDSQAIASSRVGLVPWTENEVVAAYGMVPNPTPGQPVGWSINCLVCHTAEIDGVAYFGAGAKTLDEKILADTVKMVTSSVGRYRLPDGGPDDQMAVHTHNVMVRHSDYQARFRYSDSTPQATALPVRNRYRPGREGEGTVLRGRNRLCEMSWRLRRKRACPVDWHAHGCGYGPRPH